MTDKPTQPAEPAQPAPGTGPQPGTEPAPHHADQPEPTTAATAAAPPPPGPGYGYGAGAPPVPPLPPRRYGPGTNPNRSGWLRALAAGLIGLLLGGILGAGMTAAAFRFGGAGHGWNDRANHWQRWERGPHLRNPDRMPMRPWPVNPYQNPQAPASPGPTPSR